MELIQSIKNGEVNAFKQLYDAWHRRLYFFALKSTQNPQDAEDLTQGIFLKIWENRHRLTEDLPLETQMFNMARNLTIDFYRAKTAYQQLLHNCKRTIQTSASEPLPVDLQQRQRLVRLEKAIEALPQKRKEVFKLSRYHGLTYEEIADEMGISKNTVHVHISKALSTLRSTLASFFF